MYQFSHEVWYISGEAISSLPTYRTSASCSTAKRADIYSANLKVKIITEANRESLGIHTKKQMIVYFQEAHYTVNIQKTNCIYFK